MSIDKELDKEYDIKRNEQYLNITKWFCLYDRVKKASCRIIYIQCWCPKDQLILAFGRGPLQTAAFPPSHPA